jgi:hypothetical protein
LILIVANVLRIFFWFGKDFPIVLLLQSLVMIALQLLMVRLCVGALVKKRDSKTTQAYWASFWSWDDFSVHGEA